MRYLLILIIAISSQVFAKDTELKLFRPFNGEANLIVEQTLKGECLAQSALIKRQDALHCVANQQSYDPCFIKEYGNHKKVLCLNSPWESKAIEIDLSSPIDNSEHLSLDMSRTYPWGLLLTSGEKCTAVAEDESFDGLKVHYRCDNGSFLVGHVQRCASQWSILQKKNNEVLTAAIVKAWF